MAKTNFTKVEEALEQGLRKMSVEHLFELSDEQSGNQPKPKASTTADSTADKAKSPETQLTRVQKSLINALQRDLKRLQLREHREMYSDLGIKKSELRKKIQTPANLTPEDWEEIKKIKEKIDLYKQEIHSKLPAESNEHLVESQRTTHINKRFNVHDGWLPLH